MERVLAQDRPATVERAAAVCSLARCVTRGRIFKMFWLSTPDLPATLRMLVARPLTPPARLSLSILFRVISSCCALCFVSGGSGCLFALSVRALLPPPFSPMFWSLIAIFSRNLEGIFIACLRLVVLLLPFCSVVTIFRSSRCIFALPSHLRGTCCSPVWVPGGEVGSDAQVRYSVISLCCATIVVPARPPYPPSAYLVPCFPRIHLHVRPPLYHYCSPHPPSPCHSFINHAHDYNNPISIYPYSPYNPCVAHRV